MSQEKLAAVLRILDNETQLIERADRKAIALLSILGVFMVFFIVYYRLIPITPVTVAMVAAYFACAIVAITSLVMTVRPRIYHAEKLEGKEDANAPQCEPAFFAGICKFADLTAYRKALKNLADDESTAFNVYSKQVFSLAHINTVKYKHLHRATFLTISSLAIELSIIVYIFANYMGAGIMPPLI